ncbi:MAG: hypothetical protein KIT08_06405 [Anaerolineales bacterium]|nr:MAG: hypothetical protein KIT08_06405 [Anaerolineales bacterium]
MLDDADLDLPSEQPEPPKRSGGRNFLVVAGILGGLMLLALIALAVYALVILPQQQRAAPDEGAAQVTNTQIVQTQQPSNTATAQNTPTRTATATRTPVPPTATNTPVTPLFTSNPAATQTVEALLTQAALAQEQAAATTDPGEATATTAPTATPSALPQSGLADDIGGPGILAMGAMLLLAIVFTARRLRMNA